MPTSEEIYADYLRRFQAAPADNPISGLRSLFGGPKTQSEVMREIQGVAPLLNLGLAHEREKRAQATQEMQAARDLLNAHREFATLLKGFAKDFHEQPEDVRKATRNMTVKLFKEAATRGRYQFDPQDIEATFDIRGYADDAVALLDPILTQADRDLAAKDFAATKSVEDRHKVYQAWRQKAEQKATDLVQQAMSLLPERFAGRTNIDPKEIRALAQKEFPELSKSPSARAAFEKMLADNERMAGLGVQTGAAALAGQTTAAQEAAKGPLAKLDEKTRGILIGQGLTNPTKEQIEAARQQGRTEKREDAVAASAARGVEAERLKLGMPITPEQRAKHIRVSALLQTGELVQPEAGTTEKQLRADPDLVAIDDKQRDALSALKPSRVLLDSFQGMARRLIVAKNPIAAAQQGMTLYAGAVTGANPQAKAYLDAGEGFISQLSRALGGEKGVLTNKDRDVMKRAAVATFFDTDASRDFKAAIINDIWQAANTAVVQQIAGKGGVAPFRSQLDQLLQKLDEASTASLAKGIPADHKLIVNKETKQVNVLRRSQKTPEGWSEIK